MFKLWVSYSNGKMICLRMGGLSGVCLSQKMRGIKRFTHSANAVAPEEEKKLVERFERLIGMSLRKFEKLYHERFYFEDPMGSLSQYE